MFLEFCFLQLAVDNVSIQITTSHLKIAGVQLWLDLAFFTHVSLINNDYFECILRNYICKFKQNKHSQDW